MAGFSSISAPMNLRGLEKMGNDYAAYQAAMQPPTPKVVAAKEMVRAFKTEVDRRNAAGHGDLMDWIPSGEMWQMFEKEDGLLMNYYENGMLIADERNPWWQYCYYAQTINEPAKTQFMENLLYALNNEWPDKHRERAKNALEHAAAYHTHMNAETESLPDEDAAHVADMLHPGGAADEFSDDGMDIVENELEMLHFNAAYVDMSAASMV